MGGGAKNYTQFLKFLGDKKPFGSPFQMDFPDPSLHKFANYVPMHDKGRQCNDTDPKYRCSCVDCAASCPELPEVVDSEDCTVGVLPCLSFAVIIVYAVFLGLLVTAFTSHAALKRRSQQKNDRLRLLQDAAPSDDEDEADMMEDATMLNHPQQHYFVNDFLDRVFYTIGRFCAEFPALVMGFSVFVVLLLSLGWIRFSVETDPVRLWVAPDSAAAVEKEFFDASFGPFWRIEQAFLVNDTKYQDSGEAGPVLSYDTLRWWFDVESRVQRLIAFDGGATFDEICYKPTGDACVVESVTGYFGGSFAKVDPYSWQDDLLKCVEQPVACLPDFQQPLRPDLLFGGSYDNVLNAEAIVVSWIVENHQVGTKKEKRAAEWEESLKNLLRAVQEEARDKGLRLSFNTEMSLEEELNKSTNTDAKIIVISYLVMFLYSSLALGSTTVALKSIFRNPANALVQSKFMLGVMGIVIVLMSVSASVGLFSAAGVKVTLIIAEVIPFLVLAVGVDNIFLLAHEFERVNINHAEKSIPERVAKTLGRMGPSILLSATTETVAFALGAFVGMPAVRNFAAYAAGAVFINALLQVTMFVSVLSLNQRRMESSRADCIPCITIQNADSPFANGDLAYAVDDEGPIDYFIRKIYAPAILNGKAKIIIMTVFLGIFTAGLALLPDVKLGLDQRIAVPSDSYLIDYFNDLDHYFNAGPPVFFVTKDLNVTERVHQQELCGRFSTCKEYSLANILEQERKRPEISYIAEATASWVDDYFLWLNPSLEDCCVDGSQTCFADRDPPWNITLYGMPEGEEFISLLERWLKAPTNEDCPLAGQAAYGDAVVIDKQEVTIPASHFRTSHSSLHTQSDFIEAYRSARRIAREISAQNDNAEVFPYSKFYIFFDQYLSIVRLSATLVGAGLAVILVLTTCLLGSITTALVVTLTVLMTVVDILGTMALANVSLNAVSLVNIVICTGIAFEFCAHIARAYTFPSRAALERAPRQYLQHRHNRYINNNGSSGGGIGNRSSQQVFKRQQQQQQQNGSSSISMGAFSSPTDKDCRAWAALVNVGASVFSGITLTKLLGVVVLAFTRSKIFEIYYFRVWVALIGFAALHALVFLPVALSLLGGVGTYLCSIDYYNPCYENNISVLLLFSHPFLSKKEIKLPSN